MGPPQVPGPQVPGPAVAEPEPTPRHPPGDTSHIPPNALPVYTVLSTTLESLRPNIPEKYAKHGEDMEKRLAILFDHLNNEELISPAGINALNSICTHLEAKNYAQAGAEVLGFASTFPDEIGNWHTGVKRLVNMAEALQ